MTEEKNKKRCPFCGEEIMAGAKKCRHCGEWLDGQMPVRAVQKEETIPTVNAVPVESKTDTSENSGCSPSMIKAVMLYIVLPIVLIIIAACTVPNEDAHRNAVMKSARECVKDNISNIAGLLGPLGSVLSDAALSTDDAKNAIDQAINENNSFRYNKHWLFSTGELINSDNPDGTTVSLGIMGVVIPFVSWSDLKIIKPSTNEDTSTSTSTDSYNDSNDASTNENDDVQEETNTDQNSSTDENETGNEDEAENTSDGEGNVNAE